MPKVYLQIFEGVQKSSKIDQYSPMIVATNSISKGVQIHTCYFDTIVSRKISCLARGH